MKIIATMSILTALSVLLPATKATADDDYRKICLVNENLRVLDDDGDAVRVLTELLEKVFIPNLTECFFGRLLLLAKVEDDVFEVGVSE